MKRRRFIQTIAAAPVIVLPVLPAAQAQQTATPANAAPKPVEEDAKLEFVAPDAVGDTPTRFFNDQQFATLVKLGDILMPPFNGAPGALQAQAAEFLDFLIGASPAERQQLYRAGLDALNAQATRRFGKPFAEVNAEQAGELLAPLRQPWTYEPPADGFAHFLRAANQDVRTATINSREYNAANSAAGRRAGGVGQYWYTIE